jgi:hypothetical protein
MRPVPLPSPSTIRFTSFPLTAPPPPFVREVVEVFRRAETTISTSALKKGLVSDEVLAAVGPALRDLGFEIELGKGSNERIERPVFYGENGVPQLRYLIDAYHSGWRCGLEVEAARAWMGNAVYRDIVQALVMVEVDHLILSVPNGYRFRSNKRETVSKDYDNTVAVARAVWGHRRVQMPYGLTVLGY